MKNKWDTSTYMRCPFSLNGISLLIRNACHQLEIDREKQKEKKEKKTNIKTKIKKHSLWSLLLQLLETV